MSQAAVASAAAAARRIVQHGRRDLHAAARRSVMERPDITASTTPVAPIKLPTQARVVIIGGGVIGSSVAYHLTQLGITDVVLLEQGTVGCGTTWHAAGLIGQMRGTFTETQLSTYAKSLYSSLEEETGLATGWRPCGSLTVARTEDRLIQLKRNASKARTFGVEAHIIGPDDANKHYNGLLETRDLVGALWLPGDGVANASDITAALSAGAKRRGARVFERVRVTGVDVTRGTATGVTTDHGPIKAELVVNCAGMWARQVGAMAGVNVPLHAAEHFYVVTKGMEGVTPMLPVMRDPDAYIYFREWSGGLIMGGFELECKPCFTTRVPDDFQYQLFNEDWEHFQPLMEGALERVPSMATAEIRQMVNGPESFTADNQYILGEAPECRNFYVAAGMNSSGIASAAGAGKALAEWMDQGKPTLDLWPVDIRRFGAFHGNPSFLKARTVETLGLHYQISWPRRELESGRPLRRSPLYDRLAAGGAVFGQKMGWERPNYFETSPEAAAAKPVYTWGRPGWFDIVSTEVKHTRSEVSLFDQTSFSKFAIKGATADQFMQYLCGGDMDVPVGKMVYSPVLNTNGGYETDVTVTRVNWDEYLMISPTAHNTRDIWVMQRTLDENRERFPDVQVLNVTPMYTVLGVMGPKSRELLSKVSLGDWSNEAFPFATMKPMDVGYATVRAGRVTYVGELGYELHIPSEFTLTVFEALTAGAKEAGIDLRNAGYYAIESMRIEKGYRAWGHEIHPEVTPLEAGLGFTVNTKLTKGGGFVGSEALRKQKEEGLTQRLVSLTVDDPSVVLLGDEPILRDGILVGRCTSGTYGFTLGCSVAMGYVTNKTAAGSTGLVTPEFINTGRYEIDVNGVRVPATATLAAPFDPKGARINC